MTTYTALARLPQLVPFDPAIKNAWGPPINSAWNAVEQLAAGNGPIDLTGLTSYSVTIANNATDQARQAMLPFTGTTPGTCTVTIPAIARIGWCSNSTNHVVILTAGGATNLSIGIGQSYLYTVTGTAVTSVPITPATGGALSGPSLNVSGNATVGSLNVGGYTALATLIAGATTLGTLTANSTIVNGTLTLKFAAASATFAALDPVTGYIKVYGSAGAGLRIYTASGTLQTTFTTTGLVIFPGTVNANSFVTTSDQRAKSEIADITSADANAWVRAGRPRTYMMDGRPRAGFVAQEDVANGRGAAVYQVSDDSNEHLARDYLHDIAYLTKALASALNRIDVLEAASGV